MAYKALKCFHSLNLKCSSLQVIYIIHSTFSFTMIEIKWFTMILSVWTFVYKVIFLVVSEREKFLLEVKWNLFIFSYQHLLQQIIKLRFRMKESETEL